MGTYLANDGSLVSGQPTGSNCNDQFYRGQLLRRVLVDQNGNQLDSWTTTDPALLAVLESSS